MRGITPERILSDRKGLHNGLPLIKQLSLPFGALPAADGNEKFQAVVTRDVTTSVVSLVLMNGKTADEESGYSMSTSDAIILNEGHAVNSTRQLQVQQQMNH